MDNPIEYPEWIYTKKIPTLISDNLPLLPPKNPQPRHYNVRISANDMLEHISKLREELEELTKNGETITLSFAGYSIPTVNVIADKNPSPEDIKGRENSYRKGKERARKSQETRERNKRLKAEKEAQELLKRLDKDPEFKEAVMAAIDKEE